MTNIVDISSRMRFRNLNAKPAQPEDDTAKRDRSIGYDDGFNWGLCPDDCLAVARLAAIEAEVAAVELPKGSLAEWLDNRLGLTEETSLFWQRYECGSFPTDDMARGFIAGALDGWDKARWILETYVGMGERVAVDARTLADAFANRAKVADAHRQLNVAQTTD